MRFGTQSERCGDHHHSGFLFYRLNRSYRIEVVHAHYVKHRFVRHAHEHLMVASSRKARTSTPIEAPAIQLLRAKGAPRWMQYVLCDELIRDSAAFVNTGAS